MKYNQLDPMVKRNKDWLPISVELEGVVEDVVVDRNDV